METIASKLEQEKPEEEIYIYFEKRNDFVKAIHYLQNKNIHTDVIGCGTIIAPISTIDVLKSADFQFGTAKNSKDFYENNKEFVKDWGRQVRQYYGLPER